MTIRHTARIIILDEDDRLLLFMTHWDTRVDPPRWLTPGGGVDPGESTRQAALRELFEETGQRVDDLGQPVWHAVIPMPAGYVTDAADATYYLWRTAHFEPSTENWTDSERVDVLETRWFTAEDLAASDDVFDPENVREWLAEALRRASESGIDS